MQRYNFGAKITSVRQHQLIGSLYTSNTAQLQEPCFGSATNSCQAYLIPVLPKPPEPLSLSSKVSVSSHWARSYLAKTIWAILSPSSIVKGSVERFMRITPTSPL